jgi:DNA-binding NarL/FixJ family response regulator
MSTGKKWTSDEDERLLDLKAKGLTLRMIAKSLNRTGASVDSRLSRLRDPVGTKARGDA